MSSYLSRIAQRHSETPVIRPRSASRYERVRGAYRGEDFTGAPDVDVAPAWHTRASDEARLPSGERDPGRSPAIAPATEDVPMRITASRAWWEASMGMEASPSAVVTHDTASSVEPRRGGPVSDGGTAPDSSTVAATTASLHGAAGAAFTSAMRRAGPTIQTEGRLNDVRPRRDAAETSGSSFPSHEREPDVIRVHIGRVDVRVVQPAAASAVSRKPAPAPPTGPLPLDCYLEARGRR